MVRDFANRRSTAYDGVGVFEISGRVGGTTLFTRVTILISCSTFGAIAFDKAIRQKHFFHWIVGLLNRTFFNQPGIS